MTGRDYDPERLARREAIAARLRAEKAEANAVRLAAIEEREDERFRRQVRDSRNARRRIDEFLAREAEISRLERAGEAQANL